jgi:septum formation protein
VTSRPQPRVVLASQSPRRRDLLDLVGIRHEVRPADIDEAVLLGEAPGTSSGRTHEVFTGIAVRRGAASREAAGVERVLVTVRPLDEAEIAAYVATGEPMDKAGAYGIQGFGATIVERIEGDYFAVMGLSLVRTVALLREVGLTYPFGPLRAPEG